ncbi:MAG TPA: proton-conducting transporter membrane subunit [Streptosporangiaceae bacterium]|nr:proton-conducting transporter membrane subunit [Streptosporangiaceae bacterium]
MTAYSAVLAAGLALLALAAVVDLVLGASRPRLLPVPYLAGAAASACLAMAGAAALAGRPVALRVAGLLGSGTVGPAADRLSGLFLVIAFGAAFAVSLALASWAAGPARPARRGLSASYALALGAVAVVLTARDAFTLLFAWESLTLAFYLLSGFERTRPGRPAAALVTLAFGRISGICLLAGLLLLAGRSGSLTLAGLAHAGAGAPRSAAELLLLLGFAVKVGLVPFQVWLPRGYAAAAGPTRAIMAGVAVNVGFYGLWRTLALLGPPPGAVTGILLVLASLTAVLGIAHAAVQTSLQRVIAYSSVENSGLILAGFGVALVGAATRERGLLAAGLLAATLQIVAHTAAKSLLFTSSARMEAADGTDNLDRLRGSVRLRPWSGTGLAIGSLTLAGLPPTAGFVSEWFLLEALMQQFRVPGLGDRLVLAITGAAVALTAGFAGVTFVRLIGMVVLGKPGSGGGAAPRDYGLAGRVGIVLLGAACLVTAALTPLEIRVIAAGLSPILPSSAILGALKSPWVLQPVFADFSILSPSWLWLVMPALFLVVCLVAWAASGSRLLRVRRVPPWRSATAGVSGQASYTAFGFANPTRRVLAGVLHTRAEVRQIEGRRPGEPEDPAAEAAHIGYSSDVIEVVEEYLYRPVLRPFLLLVRLAQRLQSGRLDAYLAYMLIALVAVLAVVTALR